MSDALEKAIDNVVNVTVDACIRIVRATNALDPADSHDQLKDLIVEMLEVLKVEIDDKPVRLPN